jgi:hypothetical protein
MYLHYVPVSDGKWRFLASNLLNSLSFFIIVFVVLALMYAAT